MKKYSYVKDLTSDVAFKAYGKTYGELFENAGLALSSIICKIEKLKPISSIEVKAEADNYEDLLFNFLQQIIAVVDTDELFLCDFKVKSISEKKVVALCKGEAITPPKGNTVVKAITKHKFALKDDSKGIHTIFVTVDI